MRSCSPRARRAGRSSAGSRPAARAITWPARQVRLRAGCASSARAISSAPIARPMERRGRSSGPTRSRWRRRSTSALRSRVTTPSATATATFTNVTARAATTGTNQPPTVSITSPSAGATFTEPATITVAASASDTDGTITKVDFYRGSTAHRVGHDELLQRDADERGGRHISVDGRGDRQRRRHRDVVARQRDGQLGDESGPHGVAHGPAAGATFTAPASVAITASASDADGTVSRVDFYQGSTLLGSDTTSPYGFTWGSVGSRHISADGCRAGQRRCHENLGRGVRDRQLGDQPGAVGLAVIAGIRARRSPRRRTSRSPRRPATRTAPSRASTSIVGRRSSDRTRRARIRRSGPARRPAATR